MKMLCDLPSPTADAVRQIFFDTFLIGVVVDRAEDNVLNEYRSTMPREFYDPASPAGWRAKSNSCCHVLLLCTPTIERPGGRGWSASRNPGAVHGLFEGVLPSTNDRVLRGVRPDDTARVS